MTLDTKLRDEFEKYDYENLPESELYPDYRKLITKNEIPKVMFLNTPRFGLEYFPREEFHGLLEYCNLRDVDAVFITGDLFHMDLRKHSKLKILRAQTQEYYVKDKDIYLPEILEDEGWSKKYILTREILESLKSELVSLFKLNKKYKIPIYLVLGFSEYDTLLSLTNDEIRKEVRRDRNKVENTIRKLKNKNKKISKDGRMKDRTKNLMMRRNQRQIDELNVFKKRVIMSNFNRIKILYAEKKEELKDILESIPNLHLLDGVGRFDVNNTSVEFRYNVTQGTDVPSRNAAVELENYLKGKMIEGELVPRYFASGGLNGFMSQRTLRDVSHDSTYKVDEIVIPSISVERYIFSNVMPPFVKKKEELMDLPRRPNDSVLKMFKKFKVTSGAVLASFVHETQTINQFIYLEKFREIYDRKFKDKWSKSKLEELVNSPLMLILHKGDMHETSQHTKKVFFIDEEHEQLAENFNRIGFREFRYRFINANDLYNMVKHLIPNLVCEVDCGELLQAANYPIHHEEHDYYKEGFQFDKMMLNLEDGGDFERYYEGELGQHFKEHPPSEIELLRLNMDCQNMPLIENQMKQWVHKEVIMWSDDYRRMMAFGEKIGYYGPIKVNVGGGHEFQTVKGTGLKIPESLSRETRLFLGLDMDDNYRIRVGAKGQGTGVTYYHFGIKDRYDYNCLAMHKSHNSSNDEERLMISAMEKARLKYDVILNGHTHKPKYIIYNGALQVQNGSTQGDNEYKYMKTLPSSVTSFYLVGLPVDGFKKGEVTMIPLTLEFVIEADKNPELVEKFLSTLNIYGVESGAK